MEECKRAKDKLCIIGCSDSKSLAPINSDNYEFWGVNNLFLIMPDVKWSRWFEIHEITFDGQNFFRRGKREFKGLMVDDYLTRIAALSCPVYMQQKWPSIKNSVVYPIKEITDSFGRYITNTISYQIALGIYMEFKEIAIYGVDMAVGTEYAAQRPSCEYFVGLARGMGINVIIPDEADLLKNRFLYAFEEQKESAFAKKIKHSILSMQQRKQQAMMQRDNFNRQVEQYIGGEVGLSEMLKIWESCK
jgi:hypothetical protein